MTRNKGENSLPPQEGQPDARKSPDKPDRSAREARLAEALRANLRRRKEGARQAPGRGERE